jgi:4'-phosphopantetheinyl transferase
MTTTLRGARPHADIGPEWAIGPGRARLAAGEVHLWLAALDDDGGDPLRTLSSAERARAARIAGERERRRWAQGRAILRALLARYLQIEPAAVQIAQGANGKPALGPSQAAGDAPHAAAREDGDALLLHFNLSHSGGAALYAIGADGPVGVDIELPGRERDVVAIAGRVFGDAEAVRLAALHPQERRHAFLRAWVRHEARLKCLGAGLAGAAGDRTLWVADVALGEGPFAGGAAAVAAQRAPRVLHRWRWAAG